MKIAFFSSQKYVYEYFDKHNKYKYFHNYISLSLNESTVHLAEGYDVVCVFVNDNINTVVIESLAKYGIKLIALRCAGFNNVDILSATLHNITVVNVPDYPPSAVAEHAVSLLLSLNRKIHKSYNRVRDGNFLLDNLLGFNLYQKTVGVIGVGKIGASFAKIMLGFGCNVLAYDPTPNPQLLTPQIKLCELDELLANSHIISLHCPYNDKTKHLINANTIELMRDDVFILNTSRGGLIDTKAIKDALINGEIGYFASDVYEFENNVFFHDHSNEIIKDSLILELMMYPNVLITPHQGFFTQEAITAITQTTLSNINSFFNAKVVNQVK